MSSNVAAAVNKSRPRSATPTIRQVPAVSRAIAILRLLGNGEGATGVKSIAQALGLVPSTALHILRVLVKEELVEVDPVTKRYSLGVGMLPLARDVIRNRGFQSTVQPVLDGLSQRYGVVSRRRRGQRSRSHDRGRNLEGATSVAAARRYRQPFPGIDQRNGTLCRGVYRSAGEGSGATLPRAPLASNTEPSDMA